jgi:hypothetical protein
VPTLLIEILTLIEPTTKDVKIGFTRSLQIFFIYSSHIFLNRTNLHRDKITSICLPGLDIYKSLITRLQIDYSTWTLVINVLLRVSDYVFNSDSLAGYRSDQTVSSLFKAVTEVLLLAFEKASVSYQLPNDLWDQLMGLMSSVNMYNDVIDKWLEVIDNLIRKAIQSYYGVDVDTSDIFNNETGEKKRSKLRKKTVCLSLWLGNPYIPDKTTLR